MNEVTISLNDRQRSTSAGFTQAVDLYKEFDINPDERRLYLEREEVVIPLLSDEYIIIHGGEKFSDGEINPNMEENLDIKQAVCPELNGKKMESGFTKAKIATSELRERDEVQPNKLFIELQGQADVFVPEGATILVQEVDSYFIIPAGDDDAIDLELCARYDRKPPKGQRQHYKIKIDGVKYRVKSQEMTGEEILSLAGKKYDQWTMNQKFRGGRRKPIEAGDKVDLTQPGVERFETVPRQAQQG